MAETSAHDVTRTPRYQVRDPQTVSASLQRGTDALMPAELLDLSLDGARLSVTTQVACHDGLCLKLENDRFGLNVAIEAVVRWVRGAQGDTWLLGCSFASPLPPEAIEALTMIGCLEQDELARSPAAGKMQAWQEAQPVAFTVELVDLSPGGVSLFSPDPAQVGQRLRLLQTTAGEKEAELIVQVRCCAETSDGYFLGCQFETRSGYRLLKDLAPSPPAIRRRAVRGSRTRHSALISRTTILILGSVLIGMSVGLPAPHLATAGLASVVAYLGLELVAQGRRLHKASTWERFFGELIEQRLDQRLELMQSGWTAVTVG